MSLYEKLLERAVSRGRGRVVADARLGLGYTAVKLDDGAVGLAYTVVGERGGCSLLAPEQGFAGRPADLVARCFLSPHPLEATVGLATINAILNRPGEGLLRDDPLVLAGVSAEDEVAMIGYFEPLFRRLRGRVKRLWVFERGDRGLSEALSEAEMADYLPRASVAIVTAVTLINKTLEEILSLLTGAREVILLGPSTPLLADPFLDTPITQLSGLVVRDAAILRLVSEAKGTRAFGPFVDKVSLRLEAVFREKKEKQGAGDRGLMCGAGRLSGRVGGAASPRDGVGP